MTSGRVTHLGGHDETVVRLGSSEEEGWGLEDGW